MKIHQKKLLVFLIIWVIGILIPMAWLAGQEPDVDAFFTAVFEPEWTHVVVHVFLYAVLGSLLAWIFKGKARLWILIPFSVILVGILQETMQVITLNRTPGRAELFDLCVDLLGALLGWLIFWLIAKFGKKEDFAAPAIEEVNKDEG